MATWLWLKVIDNEVAETSVDFAVSSQCQHFTKPVYIFTRGLSAYQQFSNCVLFHNNRSPTGNSMSDFIHSLTFIKRHAQCSTSPFPFVHLFIRTILKEVN